MNKMSQVGKNQSAWVEVIAYLTDSSRAKVAKHRARQKQPLKADLFSCLEEYEFLHTFLWFKSRSLTVMCWRMQKLGH